MYTPQIGLTIRMLTMNASSSTTAQQLGAPKTFTIDFEANQTWMGEATYSIDKLGGYAAWSSSKLINGTNLNNYAAAYCMVTVTANFFKYNLEGRLYEYYIRGREITFRFRSLLYDMNTVKLSTNDINSMWYRRSLAEGYTGFSCNLAIRSIVSTGTGYNNAISRWIPNALWVDSYSSEMPNSGQHSFLPVGNPGGASDNNGGSRIGSRRAYNFPNWSTWYNTNTRYYKIDTNAGLVDNINTLLSDYALYTNSNAPNYYEIACATIWRSNPVPYNSMQQMTWSVGPHWPRYISNGLGALLTDEQHASRILVSPRDPNRMAFNVEKIVWEADKKQDEDTGLWSFTYGEGNGRWYSNSNRLGQSPYSETQDAFVYFSHESAAKENAEKIVANGTVASTGLPTRFQDTSTSTCNEMNTVWGQTYSHVNIQREVQLGKNEFQLYDLVYGRDLIAGDWFSEDRRTRLDTVSFTLEGRDLSTDITITTT